MLRFQFVSLNVEHFRPVFGCHVTTVDLAAKWGQLTLAKRTLAENLCHVAQEICQSHWKKAADRLKCTVATYSVAPFGARM
jgi:hypothetical protein